MSPDSLAMEDEQDGELGGNSQTKLGDNVGRAYTSPARNVGVSHTRSRAVHLGRAVPRAEHVGRAPLY